MWITFAIGSTLLAGITATFIKIGTKGTNATVAAALHTTVVCIAAWMMTFWVGTQYGIYQLGQRTLIILLLSGVTTGAAWLFYCSALQATNVNRVVPVEKGSILLTTLFAFLLFGDKPSLLKVVCLILILMGILLMVTRQSGSARGRNHGWLLPAVLSAVFSAVTTLLLRLGASGVNSYLSTSFRATVALIMLWLMVLLGNKTRQLGNVSLRSVVFLALSGIVTGLSWWCYHRALSLGPSRYVLPIDRLSIVAAVLFSRLLLREKLFGHSLGGLLLIVAGVLLLLV